MITPHSSPRRIHGYAVPRRQARYLPPAIFIGIGAMTDFSPLIANPKSLLIGAGAQLGVFIAFAAALLSGQFSPAEAMSIGIIGGADGPTAILVVKTLAPVLLGGIAIAAYSYMALIPMIQPPFMRLLTTRRSARHPHGGVAPGFQAGKDPVPAHRDRSRRYDRAGCTGADRLHDVRKPAQCLRRDRPSVKTAQNELMNIVTIFLGISVGAAASAANFLRPQTLLIIAALGLVALLYLHLWRTADRKAHECHLRRYHQPAHRFCRRVCRADGGARLPA